MDPWSRCSTELGVEVTVIPYGRWATPPASPRTKLRLLYRNLRGSLLLYRHLRALRPELVVTNTVTVPSAALAARLARVPHLLLAQEFGVEAHGVSFHFGRRRSLRLLGNLSVRVLAASHALARDLATVIEPAKLRVVYYAAEIEPVPERRLADGTRLSITMLGHKSAVKGQHQAIRAVALLRDRGIDVSLTLAGSGKPRYLACLAALTTELGVADRVEHVGFVDGSPFECFATCDAALSCSELEGLPRVVVEAMKCGCPVVGARSGGTEELITDGWNGYLYEPGDVADLASKIELLDERSHARALGANAARWARRGSPPSGLRTTSWPLQPSPSMPTPRPRQIRSAERGTYSTNVAGVMTRNGRGRGDSHAEVPVRLQPGDTRHRSPRVVFLGKSAMTLDDDERKRFALHRRYLDSVVVCSGRRFRLERAPGVRVVALSNRGPKIVSTPVFYTLAPLAALCAAAGRRPAAIVCQSPYEGAGALALRRAIPPRWRPRVQVEVHGDWRTATRLYGGPQRRRVSRASDRVADWAVRRADRVRVVSGWLADQARDTGYRGPIDTYIEFSDFSAFYDPPPRPLPARPQVVFAGALERAKAVDVLLRAWPAVLAHVADAHLTILGAGSERDRLRTQVERAGVATAVTMAPPVPRSELREVLDQSWCLCLPSRSEGLGRIVLEAMAAGRAVVATCVGGPTELVTDHENGRLVPPDDPRELAAAITDVIGARSCAETMGAAGRRRAEARDPLAEYEAGIERLSRWVAS